MLLVHYSKAKNRPGGNVNLGKDAIGTVDLCGFFFFVVFVGFFQFHGGANVVANVEHVGGLNYIIIND